MTCYFTCKIGDAEVEVKANCFAGSIGNREEPPEGPEIEIEKVTLGDDDVTGAVLDCEFEMLAEDCAAKFERGL